MINIFIRVWTVLILLLAAIGVKAQSNGELSAWVANGQVQLPDEVALDPNAQVIFASNRLLVASPGLQSGECGRVLVFEQGFIKRYELIQQLSAADFDQSCDAPDGFGFSLAFTGNTLFIGLPGQLLSADEALPAGAVLVYSRDAVGFTAEQIITGPGNIGNRAWGTRLEANGARLLVQGSERGESSTIQGFANPRSVNLVEQDSIGRWRSIRTFTGSNDTLYGQDFGLNESALFIARHTFIDIFSAGFISDTPRFNSAVDIYSINSNGLISASVFQTVESENVLFDSLESMPATNYVAPQNQSFSLYESVSSESIINEIRLSAYLGYTLERGAWLLNSEINIDTSRNTSGFFNNNTGQAVQFLPDNTFFLETGTNNQLVLETLFTPVNSQRLTRREQFFNASQLSTTRGQRPLVRDRSLIIVSNQNDRLKLDSFLATPALDPAITQAWWFGPAFDGQGVTFEVVSNNRLLMHWFTYDLSGNQMWIRGVGQLIDGEVIVELRRAMGPSFAFGAFDSDDRVVESWGQATIRFDDCTSGVMRYESIEFGSGELPLFPLVNNRLDCGLGTILARFPDGLTGSPSIAGSFFDPSREGEGIILMPIPNTRQTNPETGISRIANRVVGIWLTYTPTGEQAWYYLGIYEQCRNVSFNCVLQATQTPRSTTGPVFGPAYDPDERVSVPWGSADRFSLVRVPGPDPIQLPVNNPDGTGILLLQQSTQPVGYNRLTR